MKDMITLTTIQKDIQGLRQDLAGFQMATQQAIKELAEEVRTGFRQVRVEIHAATDDVLDQLQLTTDMVDERFNKVEDDMSQQKEETQKLGGSIRNVETYLRAPRVVKG